MRSPRTRSTCAVGHRGRARVEGLTLRRRGEQPVGAVDEAHRRQRRRLRSHHAPLRVEGGDAPASFRRDARPRARRAGLVGGGPSAARGPRPQRDRVGRRTRRREPITRRTRHAPRALHAARQPRGHARFGEPGEGGLHPESRIRDATRARDRAVRAGDAHQLVRASHLGHGGAVGERIPSLLARSRARLPLNPVGGEAPLGGAVFERQHVLRVGQGERLESARRVIPADQRPAVSADPTAPRARQLPDQRRAILALEPGFVLRVSSVRL